MYSNDAKHAYDMIELLIRHGLRREDIDATIIDGHPEIQCVFLDHHQHELFLHFMTPFHLKNQQRSDRDEINPIDKYSLDLGVLNMCRPRPVLYVPPDTTSP